MLKQHFQFSADHVDRRLGKGNQQPDIWSLVLSKEGTSHGLSLAEMHSNAGFFMLAGTETSATLLSGLTYYLLKNPSTLEKLTDEIRGSFDGESDI